MGGRCCWPRERGPSWCQTDPRAINGFGSGDGGGVHHQALVILVGNAVMDGHLDTASGSAVFWRLGTLVPGEIVAVDDAQGKTWRFAVTAVRAYPAATAPLAAIFGPTDRPHLNLITCTGTWLVAAHQYDQRLVVYTTAVS